jgi:hypothetical protein
VKEKGKDKAPVPLQRPQRPLLRRGKGKEESMSNSSSGQSSSSRKRLASPGLASLPPGSKRGKGVGRMNAEKVLKKVISLGNQEKRQAEEKKKKRPLKLADLNVYHIVLQSP